MNQRDTMDSNKEFYSSLDKLRKDIDKDIMRLRISMVFDLLKIGIILFLMCSILIVGVK